MRTWMICLAVLMLTGCTKKVYVPVETHSTEYVQTERIVTRVDTVQVQVPLPDVYVSAQTTDTVSYLRTDYAESRAEWSGGVLHHWLRHIPGAVAVADVTVSATDTVRVTERTDTIYKPVEVQVPVAMETPLTWWQRTKLDWFVPVLLSLLALLAWVLRNPLAKIIRYIIQLLAKQK